MNDLIKFNIPLKDVYIGTLPEKRFCCTNFAFIFLMQYWLAKFSIDMLVYYTKTFQFSILKFNIEICMHNFKVNFFSI